MIALALCSGEALAQETYGPVISDDSEDALPESRQRPNPCETQPQDDNVILVCRELEDDEAYRSPLPAPTRSDRAIIPGLTNPPCWVTNPGAVGTPDCIRVGSVPPPAIIIDLTQFPEPLDPDEAAAVSRADMPDSDQADTRSRTGERVPIDISDD